MDVRVYEIQITKFALKQFQRLPRGIWDHVYSRSQPIEAEGLPEVRKNPGYHDEPLKGARQGQRSIRLNRSWRLIFRKEGKLQITVLVLEVNKHDY